MQKSIALVKKLFFILLLILPAVIIQLTIQSPMMVSLTSLVQTYLPLYLCILIIVKAIGVIYPPLPGVVFTLASIPLIGWQLAYLIDVVGSTIGASIAFFLGRRYGHTIILRVVGQTIADKLRQIKVKQKNQIEVGICLRLAAGGLLSDGLAWGANLIGFRYLPFVISYIISHVITTMPIFYFIAASISLNSWMIVAAVTVLAWILIYKFKGRYFE